MPMGRSTPASIHGLHGWDRDRLFAVGYGGTAHLISDGQWLPVAPLTTTWLLEDVWCSPGGNAYAVTMFGGVLRYGK